MVMRMLRRHLPLTLLIVALLVAVSATAIATGDDSNPPSDAQSQITAMEPEAKQAMAVLNRDRNAGDALPEALAAKLDERSDFGMNPGLSRLAIGNATNSVYVIPANGHVCASLTVGDGANLTCPPTGDIATGSVGAATVTLETGGIGIYGLVPDGVESVSLQTGASKSTRVVTEDNAYYTVVPGGTPLRSVRYTGPSGPVEFAVYDPAGTIDGS
jgi:hypothetical protein